MEKRRDFVYGAFILAVSGFLVKLIGAIFRIPLTNLVGAAAMGYYSSAYSVYIVLLSLATSGMPTGIAVMVSRAIALNKPRDISRTMKIAASVFVTLGAVISIVGTIFAKPIAIFMNSEDAYFAMVALMPAVFCISVVALFKGYFQGFDNMVPTAISNLIEAAVKLCAGYGIALFLFKKGYPVEVVVGGAILGVTLSTFCAMSFMGIRYLFRGSTYRFKADKLVSAVTETPVLVKDFFATVFPLMVSSIASNLMGAVDAFVVMNRLTGYMSEADANLLWGSYGNMALTVFNLPSFLIVSIGIALVPGIAAAFAKNEFENVKSIINRAMKFTSILSFACAFGINATAEMMLRLLFSDEAGIAKAVGLLEIVSFVLVSVGFTNVTAAVLNSVKKAHLSVISVAIGAVVKSLFTFIFVSIPALNIYGAPLATNIAYPLMVIINIIFIYKHVGVLPSFGDTFVKPLFAGVGCYVSAKIFASVLSPIIKSKLVVLPVILLTAVAYLGIILLLKLVTVSELKGIFSKKKK